jgi:REP element-mobilizing transposase RayT
MPPRLIPFLANHYYHIYNRGVNREQIFFCEENYRYLLRLIRKNLHRYNISIVAYCLLPNHYHLLLLPMADNTLNQFMKSVFGSYVQGVNKQQNRLGPLFQGRFRHTLVDKDEYLIHLARYIHLNPVMAGLCDKPQEWGYSNYIDILGDRSGSLKDSTLVPDRFSDGEAYRGFVEEYLHSRKQIDGLEKYILE